MGHYGQAIRTENGFWNCSIHAETAHRYLQRQTQGEGRMGVRGLNDPVGFVRIASFNS